MARVVLVLLAIVTLSGGAAALAYTIFRPGAEERYPVASPLPDPATMQDKRTIFISGHSLTDRPMPDFLGEIVTAAGRPIAWDGQHMAGSSIRNRSFGNGMAPPWSGFAAGLRADGSPVDVLREWQTPSLANAKAYDILLITEQHRLLDSLLWQDMPTFLRAFRDRFVAANAAGQVFFFTPWLDVSDKDDPREWIAYERAAWPLWQCTVAGVSHGIAKDGGQDTIHIVPASLALAALIESLTGNAAPVGFEALSQREIVNTIFSDTVHLTPLGSYFTAAVTYNTLYGRPSIEDAPHALDAARAATLRTFAANFIDQYREDSAKSGNTTCTTRPSLSFMSRYTGYAAQTSIRQGEGYLRAKVTQIRDLLRFAVRL